MATDANTKFYFAPFMIPPGGQLCLWVERDRPLTLFFSSLFSRKSLITIIDRLNEELPDEYDAYDPGSSAFFHRIAIVRMISEDEVLAIADKLVAAARRFAMVATKLAHAIADMNGLSPEALCRNAYALENVPEGWELFPHGEHIRCTHLASGQQVEISLGSAGFGVLDPEFFCRFLETTPGLGLPDVFADPCSDMERAFDILEKHGRFREG